MVVVAFVCVVGKGVIRNQGFFIFIERGGKQGIGWVTGILHPVNRTGSVRYEEKGIGERMGGDEIMIRTHAETARDKGNNCTQTRFRQLKSGGCLRSTTRRECWGQFSGAGSASAPTLLTRFFIA